ncbi:protein of unknown function DUF928 [Rippkaea orientalis PCC 8801]|uniref:DUF928 domain-containing protein n=1 Tax=Rippkaea orientalis (strain PCC 8801 / RF-1) TaxID=41431 RepID=B7JX22_RIPO1|nr:DUF928 domain-containing protein [Rippkaea orientalis]ACK65871.1 protein of unknown function DUF928 [Rippkaea orientalis PCC 8801]
MLPKKHHSVMARVLGITSLLTLYIASFPQVSQAQGNPNNGNDSLQVPDRRKGGASRRPQPQEMNNEDRLQVPGRRKPAASRPVTDQCNFNPQDLTALIPQNLVSMTAKDSPTLFFSVPSISPSTVIELVLRGPNDELIYQKNLQGQGKAGIMKVQLPKIDNFRPSESPNQYHWYLSVICNASDRAYDVVVEGLIQPSQINTNLQQKLPSATSTEQVKLYQDHNLWTETLDTLAELKRSRPQDPTILAMWSDLLKSVELDPKIAEQPLLEQ